MVRVTVTTYGESEVAQMKNYVYTILNRSVEYMTDAVIVITNDGKEVYCYKCQQLRLWLRPEIPENCGNCNSTHITSDVVGSARLTELRFGNDKKARG